MTITLTQLYSALSDKLGKDTAETLANYIAESVQREVKDSTNNLAAKEDLANLKADLLKEMASNTRWLIGIIFTLALMILGLYFKK